MRMKIVLICIALLFSQGCILMSADHKQALTEAAIVTNMLNEKCQAGDNQACKEGLAGATETLNELVE
jgi:hypothetical protein